ncbi:MAG: ACT domain-containing protein [Chloroflexi bacterium]|nr:ACT domain-containing protein [Chloroflexota bacterium]
MADVVKRIDYYYTVVSDRPGAGARILNALKASRVNLLAFTGFPCPDGRAQLDFVPTNPRTFLAAARKARVKLVGPKTAFLVQGQDRAGTIADITSKLAEAHINITAIDAITAGRRRYGAILWVKPRNVNRAAQVLDAS